MRSLAAGGIAAIALLVLLVALGTAGGAIQDEPPAETLHVELEPNGDAHWTVTMLIDLNSSNHSEGFDRLATEFENGESDVLTVGPFRTAAERAEQTTGRTMAIQNVSRRASRANATGRLELAFRWTAFARQSDDRLLLGDVFQTETGTWLSELDEGQTLIVEFPDEYTIVDSSHKLENRAYEIRGPATFDPGMPSATLVRGGTPTTSIRTTDVTTEPPVTNETTEPPVRGDWDLVGFGALAVLLGTLAILVERRRRAGDDTIQADDADGRPGGDESAETSNPEDGAGLGADAADDGEEPLLSDDERVLRLLHQNDGRMKQAQIVEETNWSNAKVSQLLSEMAESGQLNKLRIGRENLISLPGQGPDEDE